jgi:acetyl esterase
VLGTRIYDPLCTFLARSLAAVVVSVDYRMAPEHHAPQAAYDSVDSVRWLAQHAQS